MSTLISYLRTITLIVANVTVYEIAQNELGAVFRQLGFDLGLAHLFADVGALVALAGLWAVVLLLGYRSGPKARLLKTGFLANGVLFGCFILIRVLDELGFAYSLLVGFGLMFLAFYRLSKLMERDRS